MKENSAVKREATDEMISKITRLTYSLRVYERSFHYSEQATIPGIIDARIDFEQIGRIDRYLECPDFRLDRDGPVEPIPAIRAALVDRLLVLSASLRHMRYIIIFMGSRQRGTFSPDVDASTMLSVRVRYRVDDALSI